MRRVIITAAIAGTLLIAAPAQAAPIRECGRGYGGQYSPVHNVTTRWLYCRDAKRMARAAGFIQYGEYVFHSRLTTPHHDRCRVRIPNPRSYRVDVRCTFAFYVVRWQYDSGE